MARVQRTYKLNVREHERVTGIRRSVRAHFQVDTLRTDGVPGDVRATTRASAVVLAMGSSSSTKALQLPSASMEHISYRLGEPRQYFGKHVVVIGVEPSGMESAVRLVNYGAAHVTLMSHGGRFNRGRGNVYVEQSTKRISTFEREKRLTLLLRTTLVRANGSHAVLQVGRTTRVIRAEVVVACVGFTSDNDLIKSLNFPDGHLNSRTYETSIRGVFALGISRVSPWNREGGVLGTDIEDSQPEVAKVCNELVKRFG